MTSLWKTSLAVLSLVSLSPAASATPLTRRNLNETSLCTTNQRKSWSNLTDTEKAEYIRAEKCLFSSPPKTGITGAQNRYDELHWAHIAQSNVIHGVGGFLPWHRFYVHAHEYLLQTECNYTGAQPYWDEQADVYSGKTLAESAIWGSDDLSFGTNGLDGDGCVVDGAFANTTLHLSMAWGVANYTSYCLSRAFETEPYYYTWANETYVNQCFANETYSTAWPCWSAKPHSSMHLAVGGTLEDQSASPGDPVFFLHHANLDRLWWQWQEANLTARLTDMTGRTIPKLSSLEDDQWLFPEAFFTDYFDDGVWNVTTLNHTLWMVDILPNVTVGDTMDLRGELSCAEYV